MELTGKKWENYSTPHIDKNNAKERDKYWEEAKLETCSLGELLDQVLWMKKNAELNHKDIYDIPVFLKFDDTRYCLNSCSSGHSQTLGMIDEFDAHSWDKLVFTAPDSKPENGEYWSSRGPGDYDCSGFVKSKKAGERLQRLVNYILDNDKPETWLDFRDYEPDWIQFKFSAKEFDVEKLDKMARENGDIINEKIIRECKLEAEA